MHNILYDLCIPIVVRLGVIVRGDQATTISGRCSRPMAHTASPAISATPDGKLPDRFYQVFAAGIILVACFNR